MTNAKVKTPRRPKKDAGARKLTRALAELKKARQTGDYRAMMIRIVRSAAPTPNRSL
jgi:hypothetical protein